MKTSPFVASVTLGFVLITSGFGQSATVPTSETTLRPPAADLKELYQKINTKFQTGAKTVEAFAPEFAEFDALLLKHPERTMEVARIGVEKARLYVALQETAQGLATLEKIKREFPDPEIVKEVDKMRKAIEAAQQAKTNLAALPGKAAPELNFIWSTKEGLKKLSDLKGQVVILDFWATWCKPCIGSFPQVREHVEHFKGSPVAILGVTSLQGAVYGLSGGKIDTEGDSAKEMALMRDFIKKHNMTWDVVFSQEEVFNADYGIQGIPFVAIVAPDGTVRHAGLHPGDPDADISGKIEAILKEFKLVGPTKKS